MGAGGGGSGGGSSGLILQQLAEGGSRVAQGETIAEFDRQTMMNRLDDFRANVRQAEASLKRFRSELDVTKKAHVQAVQAAKAELDKARLDLKTIPVRSAITTERLKLAADEAESSYKQIVAEVKHLEDSLRAQMRTADLMLEQAKVELRRVERDVDKMLIKSPMKGLVVMQMTWRGGEMGQVQNGDQVYPGQPLMRIVDQDSMVVNASVNQVDAELLRIGAKARARFDAYPGLELPARVYSIGAITQASGFRAEFVKEIPVVLKLESTDPRVIPDLSVSVDVILDAGRKPYCPREAVFQDQPDQKPYVFVRNGSGWERREVELGNMNHIQTAVRSGLRAGDVIALERPPAQPAKKT